MEILGRRAGGAKGGAVPSSCPPFCLRDTFAETLLYDPLQHVASKWSADKFSDKVVDQEYAKLKKNKFSHQEVRSLELAGFLERYLWPNVLVTNKELR